MKKQNLFLKKKKANPGVSKEKIKRKKSSKQVKIRGPWSEREDKLLMEWIEKHGPKGWARCAETIKGRNGKQCREHWNNSLNNNIKKGEWSSEEDLYIMVFYDKLDKSWKKMIPLFKSRTENAIKNRFFSQLRKITANYVKRDKSEYNTKFKLGTLLHYYDKGVEEAKKDFLKDHPMKDDVYNSFIKEIEDLIISKPKNQEFIELDNIRKKYLSNSIVSNNNNNNNANEDNNKKEEENKKEEIKNEEINNDNIDKDSIKEGDAEDVSSIPITEIIEETEEQKKLEKNNDNKNEINKENGEIKKNDENEKVEIKSPIKRAFGYNFVSNNNISKNINSINELKNGLTSGKSNINGQNNIGNLNINLGCSTYIHIYSNNILNNNIPNTSSNIKENNNLNNINYNYNNNFNAVPDLSLNKANQNSSSFRKMPSEVETYRKNFQNFRNFNFKNNISNNDISIESPFYKINSNSYMDYPLNPYPSYNANTNYYNYNPFKPLNSNNEIFNFDKNNSYNKEMNPNGNIVFRHMDSNDLNNLNKPSYLYPGFGYKKSTSFGSIIEGKIYDNNMNYDNNK
jgi:hypothetical protein